MTAQEETKRGGFFFFCLKNRTGQMIKTEECVTMGMG